MKALHRLIVTSSTYLMDSTWDSDSGARDPDNRYLWRMNPRRMEAEAVRDSILRVAGNLDLAMGGPELDQKVGLEVPRRSLYFRHSVEKQVEFLATFDQANVNDCYRRTASIMPQQALALANSRLSVGQSRLLARKLWEVVQERPPATATRDFLSSLFQQALSRFPTAEERAECERFLADQTARLADPKALQPFEAGLAGPVPPSPDPAMRARESLVHVLLNHNDFVTVR
jgi:hypothetical protein